jgi:hypothetical protein
MEAYLAVPTEILLDVQKAKEDYEEAHARHRAACDALQSWIADHARPVEQRTYSDIEASEAAAFVDRLVKFADKRAKYTQGWSYLLVWYARNELERGDRGVYEQIAAHLSISNMAILQSALDRGWSGLIQGASLKNIACRLAKEFRDDLRPRDRIRWQRWILTILPPVVGALAGEGGAWAADNKGICSQQVGPGEGANLSSECAQQTGSQSATLRARAAPRQRSFPYKRIVITVGTGACLLGLLSLVGRDNRALRDAASERSITKLRQTNSERISTAAPVLSVGVFAPEDLKGKNLASEPLAQTNSAQGNLGDKQATGPRHPNAGALPSAFVNKQKLLVDGAWALLNVSHHQCESALRLFEQAEAIAVNPESLTGHENDAHIFVRASPFPPFAKDVNYITYKGVATADMIPLFGMYGTALETSPGWENVLDGERRQRLCVSQRQTIRSWKINALNCLQRYAEALKAAEDEPPAELQQSAGCLRNMFLLQQSVYAQDNDKAGQYFGDIVDECESDAYGNFATRSAQTLTVIAKAPNGRTTLLRLCRGPARLRDAIIQLNLLDEVCRLAEP